jgi:hypothetical protein
VVADVVMAEALQLVPVYHEPLFLENSIIAQSISRITPNYHLPIRPISTYQMRYVNLYVFILTCEYI